MDFMAIVHQIDEEIDRLERVRKIVASLSRSRRIVGISEPQLAKKKRGSRETPVQQLHVQEPVIAEEPKEEPKLIVLPPRAKREYSPRTRMRQQATSALTSTVPNRPVFVPKATVVIRPEPVAKNEEMDLASLEAAFRQKLLGVAG